MHWSWYVTGGLIFLYSVRIFAYLAGWKKSIGEKGKPRTDHITVSVIIPFRNEEKLLPLLLADLTEQEYPPDRYEVILVDDHSTDQTVARVSRVIEMHSNIHLIKLGDSGYGKKHALYMGVRLARGEMILTTDGDCRAGPGWIREMVREFSVPSVRMVIGAVLFEPVKGLFQKMQTLELLSLTGTAAGAAGTGKPILCNAANMAFSRTDYLHFQEESGMLTPSGDDIFLMLWIKKKYPGSVRFAASPRSVVRTIPMDTVSAFFNQRIRWTSKTRFYRDRDIIMTALVVYLVNLCLLITCIAGFLQPAWILPFLAVMAIKSITDLIFLSAVLQYYSLRKLLWLLLPIEIIYFMYVSVIGLVGQIFPYEWKGRKIRITQENPVRGYAGKT
jgi:cellulose synthase/poly-beta-1,6-N-acetylglucosamine synthase-like glycosyltransferase